LAGIAAGTAIITLSGAVTARYFHDITGHGQSVTSNGHFLVRPGYDLATGIGTPIMAALITATP
jgi:hypothetical protein